MGSCWALVCSTAFVLVLLSSASNDEYDMEQREITFDLDKIMQEMELPDSVIMQREVDVTDLFNPRGPPRFGPRSFGGPPFLEYDVQFPLGRPNSDNLQGICLNGDLRPRYPDSFFPASGFGQQRRRATAVNNAESWFSTCCKGNQTWGSEVTLCCATQAWELSVRSFCEEDSSIKDRLYQCCRLTRSEWLNCFNNDAKNPNYDATLELPVEQLPSAAGFSFDPNTCQRTVMTPYSVRQSRKKKKVKSPASQKVDISFPPGRPTADNIESLCRDQNLRPLYKVNCLPKSGYELLTRQARTINRVEKGFKKCCKKKKNVLNCADHKWRKELNKFCVDETGGQVDFHCCVGEQYSCFQNISPDPHYNMSAAEELSLNNICDTHKITKGKFPGSFPLHTFVKQCCPLSEVRKNTCMRLAIGNMSEMCSENSHPAVSRCCRMSSQTTSQCLSQLLMDAIRKATNEKKKKKCPLS
ncbi:extracellular matrix protein 1-like [Centropristis striata]|uniref:extracellular matrix protein 1-like n=1 Tax=Centropristis striata TaxID=184440 RepID=UPI0027E17379|nr:extracellular matrix protein 1-like [Centropristis striata]